jgi:hypothetical protein
MTPDGNHLYEERLIAAVLAEEELSQDELNHLALCSSCQALRDSIAADLAGLEDMGRQAVKIPPRNFQLPEEPPVVNRTRTNRLALGGSLALAAVALIAVWLGVWGPQPADTPNITPSPLLAPMPQPDPMAMPRGLLLEDHESLVGLGMQEMDTFSPFQRFVLGGDETATSEEFMKFIIPNHGHNGRGMQGGAA